MTSEMMPGAFARLARHWGTWRRRMTRADHCGYLPSHAGHAGQDLQPLARPLSEGDARLWHLYGHPGFCRCPPVNAARRGI